MFEDLHEEFSSIKESEFLKDKPEIIKELSKLLLNSIKEIKEKEIGIAFSGGLDSTLLAFLSKKANKKFKLYTVGLQNSSDLEPASRCAIEMKWPIKIKIPSKQEATSTIEEVKEILSDSEAELNQTNIGIACVLYSVLKLAKQDKIKTILTGLGAEEIFAGYMRHSNYKKDFSVKFIQNAMIQGLKDMEKRDLSRDLAIANHLKVNLVAPFLNKNLVKYSMKIHPSLKVNKEKKKIILRETAESLGVPKEPSWRKKVAAQYGSGFSKLIKKTKGTGGI